MARGPRLELVGVPLHVIQRGNNHGACFASDDDCRRYLYYLSAAAARCGCAIHAYVLMTNHVHLLLTPHERYAVSDLMQQLGRRYVRKFNESHGRTGTLWEGRFRSSVIDSERYFLVCQRYIEYNPLRAGMVRLARDYPWSSYRHHAEGRLDPLLTEHECYLQLGRTAAERIDAYRILCAEAIALDDVDCIRASVNRGRPLGTAHFNEQVADAVQLGSGHPRGMRRMKSTRRVDQRQGDDPPHLST